MASGRNADKRTDRRIAVDLLLNKYLRGRPYLCRASDISRNGLLVHRIHEPESEETVVGLQFQLPSSERIITCVGHVVHDHRWLPAQGIQFTSIAPEHQDLIDDYLSQEALQITDHARS
jgi:hypothetical protein